jgi:outer membrane protein assembly factor BamB
LAGLYGDGGRRLASTLPAIAHGTAFVPTAGSIIARDLTTATDDPRWSTDLGDNIEGVPAMACGVILVPGLNQLTALDPDTGEEYWQADVGGVTTTTVGARDDRAYVSHGTVTAIDVTTGDVMWRTEDGGDTLAVGPNGVYTTLNTNGTGGIYAHDLDGEERWQLSLGKIVGSATVTDGTVWVADTSGTVYAIDAMTGETYWSRTLEGVTKIHSGLAVHDDAVIVPAGNGSTSYVLDAATGEPRWRNQTGMVTGRPVIGDDWIALGRTNEGISVYGRATGTHRTTWSRNEYDLGTIDGLAPVEDGFIVREGSTSELVLLQ